jgi:S-adenosylmethionine decarboxylase
MKQNMATSGPAADAAAGVVPPGQPDYTIERDGKSYAGIHSIIDMWGAKHIDDIAHIERGLRQSVAAARATLLHIHLHHFAPGGGVSGVAVLAESHISVHTWPERAFAAFDIFTCGDTDPEAAIAVLTAAFEPERVEVREYLRGGGE